MPLHVGSAFLPARFRASAHGLVPSRRYLNGRVRDCQPLKCFHDGCAAELGSHVVGALLEPGLEPLLIKHALPNTMYVLPARCALAPA